jgi:hypothetical protein
VTRAACEKEEPNAGPHRKPHNASLSLAIHPREGGHIPMTDSDMWWTAALTGGSKAQARAAALQELDAFAWELLSRLTGGDTPGGDAVRDIPLDMDTVRG